MRNVVIVRGGTAGWMTTAVLAKFLHPQQYQIILIESNVIGIGGGSSAWVFMPLPPVGTLMGYILLSCNTFTISFPMSFLVLANLHADPFFY